MWLETRATFGFTAAGGSTDDGRLRQIAEQLPPEYARNLFDAYDRSASEAELRDIAAEGLGHAYFRARETRARGLDVHYSDIDYADFQI